MSLVGRLDRLLGSTEPPGIFEDVRHFAHGRVGAHATSHPAEHRRVTELRMTADAVTVHLIRALLQCSGVRL
jgi:hypothetical protein